VFFSNTLLYKANTIIMQKYIKQIEDYMNGKTEDDIKVVKPSSPFHLPITYLDNSVIHQLSPIVANDLELETNDELNNTNTNKSGYDALFSPKHAFAKNMVKEWKRQYTTNIPFLQDTQSVLRQMPEYKAKMSRQTYQMDCEQMTEIWKDTKEDPYFLEKYSYMDWEMLNHLNHSSSFLQTLALANITSPLMSLIIPILFLIFPFIILKIQNIPISFDVYIDTLKSIAKNHFIGKTLMNMQNLNWMNVVYMLCTFGLYLMQIYQNVTACFRFYRNINKVNDQLCYMREYLDYSIHSMDTFVAINGDKPTYRAFLGDIAKYSVCLKRLSQELEQIRPFKPQVSKMGELGYMLKCYYELYADEEYSQSLLFSYSFEGYINNMMGVHDNLSANAIKFAEYDTAGDFLVKGQYYPQHKDIDYVTNDCSFDKNIIITGPNASGKTTILKTTTINIIFSQQLGCGFYESCTLNPYTHIHSYLNIPDTSGRDSLFQAESRRCKEILDVILATDVSSTRHFCIFDELYSGTNPVEATKSAYSFLLYLTKFANVDFALTTHYVSICKKFKKSEHIRNHKMNATIDDLGKMHYTYKMKQGISKIQGAIRILEEMNYPKEILDNVKNC